MTGSPATPGLDYAGRMIKPAAGTSFKPGDLVFGVAGTSPLAGGAMAEYAIVQKTYAVAVPEGVSMLDASTLGVAALTAYQSVATRVKKGDRVFINAGSGGTGIFGIQFAKVLGCHVTTTCSAANIEFVKSLGADEVIDYRKGDVVAALLASGEEFDHAVDNAGMDKQLIWRSHEYMKPGASYVLVAGGPSIPHIVDALKRKMLPKFLGGIKGKIDGFWPEAKPEHLTQVAEWVRDGKVKAVVDTKFGFEEGARAFEKLKTGRARGKVVVDVALETYKQGYE